MSKEVAKFECKNCESLFRIIYDPVETSGHPKVCPFCDSDLDSDDYYEQEEEN